MNEYNVIDLFCGCGGFSSGFRAAGFNIALGIDLWEEATRTYALNFSNDIAVCRDICDTPSAEIPDHDVLIGGFPCQSFSTVNPTKDPFDDRANLYRQMVRIAMDKQPSAFIAENVKGMMTLKGGSIFNRICTAFEDAGYVLSYKLVNAANYGIPQKRERVIIVGVRKDLGFKYEFPSEPTADKSCYL